MLMNYGLDLGFLTLCFLSNAVPQNKPTSIGYLRRKKKKVFVALMPCTVKSCPCAMPKMKSQRSSVADLSRPIAPP